MPTRALCVALSAVVAFAANAGEVKVAVAANLAGTLQKLALPFGKAHGHSLSLSSASTGKLYAQIVSGAPFEVFLSADAAAPQRLEAEGHAVAGTRFTYALGQLVLWSPKLQLDDGAQVLRQARFKHLAVANASTAPYGAAAMQVLERLQLRSQLTPLLVTGENISQTLQFVEAGGAELGFVAASQVIGRKGSSWAVPAALHEPIEQQAVLLNPGAANPAARALLEFLRRDAREAIRAAGYGLP